MIVSMNNNSYNIKLLRFNHAVQVSNSLSLFIVARNQNSKIFATNNLRAIFYKRFSL